MTIVIRRPFKKQLQWSNQAMLDAMKAVKDGQAQQMGILTGKIMKIL